MSGELWWDGSLGVELVVWVHLITTGMMTGLIWFVQVVHYPLFDLVGSEDHARYHAAHMARCGVLIAPLMLGELGSGLILLARPDVFASYPCFIVSMGLLAVVWISTFLVQVRFHHALDLTKDRRAIRALVTTNWLRTVLWTARLILLVPALGAGEKA